MPSWNSIWNASTNCPLPIMNDNVLIMKIEAIQLGWNVVRFITNPSYNKLPFRNSFAKVSLKYYFCVVSWYAFLSVQLLTKLKSSWVKL
jgi:hypothetical protein